jgi:hypothetical protein
LTYPEWTRLAIIESVAIPQGLWKVFHMQSKNYFLMEGRVNFIRTFATAAGNFGAKVALECESYGIDGRIKAYKLNATIWNNGVDQIQVGDLIRIEGYQRVNKLKDKFGNETWVQDSISESFEIIQGKAATDYQEPQKTNPRQNLPVSNAPIVTEEDVPF